MPPTLIKINLSIKYLHPSEIIMMSYISLCTNISKFYKFPLKNAYYFHVNLKVIGINSMNRKTKINVC